MEIVAGRGVDLAVDVVEVTVAVVEVEEVLEVSNYVLTIFACFLSSLGLLFMPDYVAVRVNDHRS